MKILIISPGNITNPLGGATVRAHSLAVQLKKKGNRILILEPEEKENKTDLKNFEIHHYTGKIGKRSLSNFCDINPSFILNLIKLLNSQDINIIQVEFPWGVSISKIICKLFRKKCRVVYNSHNYQVQLQKEIKDYHKTSPKSSFSEKLISNFLYLYTKIIERLAVKLADLIICVSKSDEILLRKNYDLKNKKIEIIPNGTEIQKISQSKRDKTTFKLSESKITIVFHGSYKYPPNYEAINYIKSYIYPKFKKELKKVEFIVAGAEVPVSNELTGLKFLGFVDDIYSLLKSSDIAIVPIISGAGTKLKVLDYLGSSLPTVVTKKGIEGVNAVNCTHAIIVDDVNQVFINAIKYLIKNEKERVRIGKNALKLAEEKYNWDKIGEKLANLYDENS